MAELGEEHRDQERRRRRIDRVEQYHGSQRRDQYHRLEPDGGSRRRSSISQETGWGKEDDGGSDSRYRRDYYGQRRDEQQWMEVRDSDRRRRRDSPTTRYEGAERERERRRYRDRDHFDDGDEKVDYHGRPAQSRRNRTRSRSPIIHAETRSDTRAVERSKASLPSQSSAFTASELGGAGKASPAPQAEKQKPNFANTGRLAAESNTVALSGGATVVLKYHEPPEARKPPAKEAWRLYVFKGEEMIEVVELCQRSCWLIGRERLVVDFPLDHPSCSKQHAAIQFRFVEKRNEYGDRIGKVKPYLIDLESSNGSSVNGDVVPPGRYVELRDKDVLRFGLSTREYVLMLPPS